MTTRERVINDLPYGMAEVACVKDPGIYGRVWQADLYTLYVYDAAGKVQKIRLTKPATELTDEEWEELLYW